MRDPLPSNVDSPKRTATIVTVIIVAIIALVLAGSVYAYRTWVSSRVSEGKEMLDKAGKELTTQTEQLKQKGEDMLDKAQEGMQKVEDKVEDAQETANAFSKFVDSLKSLFGAGEDTADDAQPEPK